MPPNRNSILSCFIVIISFLIIYSVDAVADQRFFPNSYAVVIGIDRYMSPSIWQQTHYGREDALAISRALKSTGYNVKELLGKDATRHNILHNISEELARDITGHDRVLVFFSGHGATREVGWRDFGYIVPYDGTDRFPSWISMSDIRELSEQMLKARHVLFVFASSIGGSIWNKAGTLSKGQNLPRSIERISANRARQFIIAGDRDASLLALGQNGLSNFTENVLQALKGRADFNQDKYIIMSELTAFLSNAQTTPNSNLRWGVFPQHEQGEFWFSLTANGHPRVSDTKISLLKPPPLMSPMVSPDEPSTTPLLLIYPQGPIDNLTKIKGINVDIQADLYALGIFHYWQIAEWTDEDLGWLREKTFLIGNNVNRSWIDAAQRLETK